MTEKVLVAYATKHGGTREIAERVGAVLADAGMDTDVREAGEAGSVEDYRAVVLGIAVYVGKWHAEGVAFLEANEAPLVSRPLWIFSSGPTGEGDPVELLKGWRYPEGQADLVSRIRPRDTAVFHGALDPSSLGFIERQMIKVVKAPTGDFRDWDRIEAWAHSIADALGASGSDSSVVES